MCASQRRLTIEVKTFPIHDVKAVGRKFFGSEGNDCALDLEMSLMTAFFHIVGTQLSHQTGVVQMQQCRVEGRAALQDGIGNAI